MRSRKKLRKQKESATDERTHEIFKVLKALFMSPFSFLILFWLGAVFYNGQAVQLECKYLEKRHWCNYNVSFLGIVLDHGENKEFKGWREKKHAVIVDLDQVSIRIGFGGFGAWQSSQIKDADFLFSFNPFSSFIFWLIFVPITMLLIGAGYLVAETFLHKN